MKKKISLSDLIGKWDFDAKNWNETLFLSSTYRSTSNAHPKIMVVLRQGYEFEQSKDYDFFKTPTYNNVTERRVASLCRAVLDNSSISRSLSVEQREKTINDIAWMNIAPPLLVDINGKKTSNWDDIKFYMKMDNWKRAKECQAKIDALCPDIIFFSGTYGVFYDYYIENAIPTPVDITDTLTTIDDLGRLKSYFFVCRKKSSRLFVEIPHISTPCVKMDENYYSFWGVLDKVVCGCKEWLRTNTDRQTSGD